MMCMSASNGPEIQVYCHRTKSFTVPTFKKSYDRGKCFWAIYLKQNIDVNILIRTASEPYFEWELVEQYNLSD